jgi:hypothetical protein
LRRTSQKKIVANRQNAAHSAGPTSTAGKRHSARNALKHGIFTKELSLSDEEKPEFEGLSNALRSQFKAATPMQEIAVERVVGGYWRYRRASRLANGRVKKQLDLDLAEGNTEELIPETRLPSRWYGSSRSELRAAMRFFADLHDQISADGFLHHEDWKDKLIKTCGHQDFYDSLMQLKPELSWDEIRLFDALSAKVHMYQMSVPPGYQPDLEKARVIAESRARLEVAVRLVEERMRHLEDLARMNAIPVESPAEGHGGNSLEVVARYLTSTTRELEHAVRWFLELRDAGL